MDPKDRILVALDVNSVMEASSLVRTLAPYVGGFKVGLELITLQHAGGVAEFIRGERKKVFWDGKLPDIPETNGRAAAATAEWGVHMFNVHANSGVEAMRAAVKNRGGAEVLAVTVLTSLDDDLCKEIYGDKVAPVVLRFADMALEAGVNGLVCSPRDLAVLAAENRFKHLTKVTPGVRPTWAAPNEQKRVMTPGEAIKAGSDYLVIGRPITKPPLEIGGPVEAVKRIVDEIAQAM